jgi:hypothetical protein
MRCFDLTMEAQCAVFFRFVLQMVVLMTRSPDEHDEQPSEPCPKRPRRTPDDDDGEELAQEENRRVTVTVKVIRRDDAVLDRMQQGNVEATTGCTILDRHRLSQHESRGYILDAVQSSIEVKMFDAVKAGLDAAWATGPLSCEEVERCAERALRCSEFTATISRDMATLAESVSAEERLRDMLLQRIPVIEELAGQCPVLGPLVCIKTSTHHPAACETHPHTWKEALRRALVLLHWYLRHPESSDQLRQLKSLGIHHLPSWKRTAALEFACAARERVVAIGLGSTKVKKKQLQRVVPDEDNCEEIGEVCYSVLAENTRSVGGDDDDQKGRAAAAVTMEGVEVVVLSDAFGEEVTSEEVPSCEPCVREAGFADDDFVDVVSAVRRQRRQGASRVPVLEDDPDWFMHLDDCQWGSIAPGGTERTNRGVFFPDRADEEGLVVDFPMDDALRRWKWQGGGRALNERIGDEVVGSAVARGCSDRVVLWMLYSVIASRCDTGRIRDTGALIAAKRSCLQIAEVLTRPVRLGVFEDLVDRCTRPSAIPLPLAWMRHACALFLTWTAPVWRSCERLFGLNPKLAGCSVRAMKPSALLAELRGGNVDSRAFPDDSAQRLEVFQDVRRSAEALCDWSLREEPSDHDAVDFAMEMLVYYHFVDPPRIAGIHRSQRAEGYYPFRCGFNASDLVDFPDIRREVNSIAHTVQRVFERNPEVLRALVSGPGDKFQAMCARFCPVRPAIGEVLLSRFAQMTCRCVATTKGSMLHSDFVGRATWGLLRGMFQPSSRHDLPGADRVMVLLQSLVQSLATKGYELQIIKSVYRLFNRHLIENESRESRRFCRAIYSTIVELVSVGVIADLCMMISSKCAEMIALTRRSEANGRGMARAMADLVKVQKAGLRMEFMWTSIECNNCELIDSRGGDALRKKMTRMMRSFRSETAKYERDLPGLPRLPAPAAPRLIV